MPHKLDGVALGVFGFLFLLVTVSRLLRLPLAPGRHGHVAREGPRG